jgi:hypothetical protein
MGLLKELAQELWKMFLADARLTASVLLLVAAVAGSLRWLGLPPLWAGGILLGGSLAILVEAVLRQTRASR